MRYTRSPFTRLGMLVGAVVALAAPAAQAQAQTTLRYKFKDGEKLHYLMEQKMVMKMNVQGQNIVVDTTMTMDMTWNVLGVDKEGAAKIIQKFGRFRFAMNGPMGKIDYDSKDGNLPQGPIGALLGPLLKTMTGLEISVTMEASGQVRDFKVPAEFVKAIKHSGGTGGLGEMFSEESLKRMSSQGSIAFPKEGMTKGKAWEQKMDMKMPFGRMDVTNAMTYDGPVERGGRMLEMILIKPTLQFEADPNSPTTIRVKNQDSKGAAYFDNNAGRLVEIAMTQNMDMEIGAGGQTIDQTIEQKVTLKLQEK